MSVYTQEELAFELSTKIVNGYTSILLDHSETTNSTSYSVISATIINMDLFRKNKISDILLVARSSSLGADGLDVQLYDFDNAAEIGIITFGGAEDQTVKTASLKTYLQGITGRIFAQLRIKKAGPIGPSTIRGATLEHFGVLV